MAVLMFMLLLASRGKVSTVQPWTRAKIGHACMPACLPATFTSFNNALCWDQTSLLSSKFSMTSRHFTAQDVNSAVSLFSLKLKLVRLTHMLHSCL